MRGKKAVFYILGLISFRFINAFRNGILHSFAGIYLRENMALTVTEANFLFTGLELIGALAQFFVWGAISDKYRARTSLIIMGTTIPSVGYIGIYYLHKYLLQTSGAHAAGLSIVFGISVLEFFWGAGFIGFFALIADIPNPKMRSRYMGYAASVTAIARISGSVVGGLFYSYKYEGGGFGEGILFYILSTVIWVFAALSWFTRKETEIHYEKTNDNQIEPNEIRDKKLDPLTNVNKPKQQSLRLFYMFLISINLISMSRGAVDQIVLYYLRLPESISATSVAISLFVTAYWIGYMIAGTIAGELSGRNVTIGFLVVSTWLSILPFFYTQINSVTLATILYATKGMAMGAFGVTSFSLIVKVIPDEKRGRLLGQYNASLMMMWGIGGSLIGGPLADYQINQGTNLASAYISTFYVAVLIGLGAIGLILWKSRSILQNPEN